MVAVNFGIVCRSRRPCASSASITSCCRQPFSNQNRFSTPEIAFLVRVHPRVRRTCSSGVLGQFYGRSFGRRRMADFSLHPLGRRVWDFFWEVLCQAKVIKQRPAPGIAHAFVFWGFLAFALVSPEPLCRRNDAWISSTCEPRRQSSILYSPVAWALLVAVSISRTYL